MKGSTEKRTQKTSQIFRVNKLAAHISGLRKLEELYDAIRVDPSSNFFAGILRVTQVTYSVADDDLARIPKTGPVVVVANHPHGILDGAIAGDMLLRVRPDVKILTNGFLASVPELQPHCIWVNPFGGTRATEANRKGTRQCLDWLKNGGLLMVFPAGEVSHWRPRAAAVLDPSWNEITSRLIAMTGASAVPLFFEGTNSIAFHALGMVHPWLRTASLAREVLKARGRCVTVRVGSPIPAASIRVRQTSEATDYLRCRTYLLHRRANPAQTKNRRVKASVIKQEPVVQPVEPEVIMRELEALPPENLLERTSEFSVYFGTAQQLPNVLKEIGRLREVTFRAVGEGTGLALDLDRFDSYYYHLLVWHNEKHEIVGAYRLGDVRQILQRFGLNGLYTQTLFRYDPGFFQQVGPAIELGRSFVRLEYQRQYAPLLLLWKGIGAYLVRHPETPVLLGPVSMSNSYNRVSRELLVRYFSQKKPASPLCNLVHPRRPFRLARIRDWEARTVARLLEDDDALSTTIADIEHDSKGLPILLRHYLRLGGQVLAFNVDREFSDVLDGLLVVDLRTTPFEVLSRYMGKIATTEFLAKHGVSSAPRARAAAASRAE